MTPPPPPPPRSESGPRAVPRGGHRGVPHTADVRVEAWAPTREECLAHAVRGVCKSFLDLSAADAGGLAVRRREVEVRAGTDEDLLVALLDEVVYRLDVAGEAPVAVEPVPVPGGVRVVLRMVDADGLPATGAPPKAVTLHGLSFAGGPAGWRCSVTLDV
ncbi:archease [Streptomyces sp. TRM43335]|uniref:Archease n=1 Tax=Streptomyces taklimakanensis TaxID=2569853 RepID=A0A6G2BDX9_9ACTN|nr:archease [Streptomyces taklimakanensis]MTE20336.1 archease [Streptomyces taklimakanensis]